MTRTCLSSLWGRRQARTTVWVIPVLLVGGVVAIAAGQSRSTVRSEASLTSEIRDFRSSANGEPYRLFVSLPTGYEASSQRYSAVFVLDADLYFELAAGVCSMLGDEGALPRVIVIGVGYSGTPDDVHRKRFRDQTPTSVAGSPGSGGGEQFLRLLTREIVPYVDQQFRTTDHALVGHSLGGLFVLFTMFREPTVFQRYIALSPLLSWDSEFVFKQEAAARASAALAGRVFIAVGGAEDPALMVSPTERMTTLLSRGAYPDLTVTFQVMPSVKELGVVPGGLTNGLKAVFARGGAYPYAKQDQRTRD